MSKLDEAIRDRLSKEDAEFLARLDQEPGAFQQAVGVLQGPFSWLHRLFLAAGVLFGILGLYTAWQFGVSTELRPLFYWGAASAFCFLGLSVVRLVFFMQINTNRILRELKRVELQVARLAAKSER